MREETKRAGRDKVGGPHGGNTLELTWQPRRCVLSRLVALPRRVGEERRGKGSIFGNCFLKGLSVEIVFRKGYF
jgi:hypothetical protein